jgi:hypothetical protein
VAELLAFLAVAGAFGAIMGGFVLLAARMRRRGLGGALMGPIDELYNPSAHQFRHEIQIHEQRMVPMPSPDEPRTTAPVSTP